jgi:hypothetical protein
VRRNSPCCCCVVVVFDAIVMKPGLIFRVFGDVLVVSTTTAGTNQIKPNIIIMMHVQ